MKALFLLFAAAIFTACQQPAQNHLADTNSPIKVTLTQEEMDPETLQKIQTTVKEWAAGSKDCPEVRGVSVGGVFKNQGERYPVLYDCGGSEVKRVLVQKLYNDGKPYWKVLGTNTPANKATTPTPPDLSDLDSGNDE